MTEDLKKLCAYELKTLKIHSLSTTSSKFSTPPLKNFLETACGSIVLGVENMKI